MTARFWPVGSGWCRVGPGREGEGSYVIRKTKGRSAVGHES